METPQNRNVVPSPPAAWPGFTAERVVRDFLSAEQFARCCGRIWTMDKRCPLPTSQVGSLPHGTSVYGKRDRLHTLWPALLRRRSRVVLVTSESANAIESNLEIPAQVAQWFGTNSENDAVQPLPLGLGNSYCGVTAKALDLAPAVGCPKTKLLYVNFRPETNPAVRGPLWEHFASEAWADTVTRESGSATIQAYVRNLASHRFVLCPRGRGVDTHRMWEALYVGTIPVVESHPALDSFRDLPILFVEDLAKVERAQLEAAYGEMLSRSWNREKLFLPWWQARFEKAKQGIAGKVGWRHFLARRLRRGRAA